MFLDWLFGGCTVELEVPEPKFRVGDEVYILGTQTPSFVADCSFDGEEWKYKLVVDVEAVYPYDFDAPYVYPESMLELY